MTTEIQINNDTIKESLKEAPTGTAYYRTLRRFQKAFAEQALLLEGGNQSKAAERMGVNRASLRTYLGHKL